MSLPLSHGAVWRGDSVVTRCPRGIFKVSFASRMGAIDPKRMSETCNARPPVASQAESGSIASRPRLAATSAMFSS